MQDLHVTAATPADHAELFELFADVVATGDGWPQAPPLDDAEFRRVWVDTPTAAVVARAGGRLVGAYYLKPNYVGRAAHICNAGYVVAAGLRGHGIGTQLVEHSFDEARRLGFDAMIYNLVFASNPARRLYERLGFRQVGVVPAAVDGEDAIVYWRAL